MPSTETMLSRKDVEALLVLRIFTRCDVCNSHYGNHVEGQIKALAVVLTGRVPSMTHDALAILDHVGIPYVDHGDEWEIPEEWMVAHGFSGMDCEQHDRLGLPW